MGNGQDFASYVFFYDFYGFRSTIKSLTHFEFILVCGVRRWSRILLGHKKEENFTLCDNMDGPAEHYAK